MSISHLVLGRNPRRNVVVAANIVFQPAIRVGDRLPEMFFYNIATFRWRIGERRRAGSGVGINPAGLCGRHRGW